MAHDDTLQAQDDAFDIDIGDDDEEDDGEDEGEEDDNEGDEDDGWQVGGAGGRGLTLYG
jgi:hypothetical protein